MKPVCLIPARSGSKGLRDKNMLYIDKKPMIFHTIDCAIDSGCFELKDIYVSTDSVLYKEICEKKGVSVQMRPEKLALDTTSSFELSEYFLKDFDDDQIFVLLQVTSPLRSSLDVKKTLELYNNNDVENVVSYSKLSKSPRMFTHLTEDNMIVDNLLFDEFGCRRQDEEPMYYPNGAIYITSKKTYLKNRSYFTKKTMAYVMDKETSVDVDDKIDFMQVIGQIYFDYQKRDRKKKPAYAEVYEKITRKVDKKNIILSDSMMINFDRDDYYNMSIVGVTLDTIVDNIYRLEKLEIDKVFISVGLNDFASGYDYAVIKSNFEKLLTFFSYKGTKIYLSTIMYSLFRVDIDNAIVKDLNEYLLGSASKNEIKMFDINSFVSKDCRLLYEYTNDGVSLNRNAEEMIYNEISDFLNQN